MVWIRAQTLLSQGGETADRYITGQSTDYTTARSTSTACDNTGATGNIGQAFVASNYYVYRAFVTFDTSSIPDDATVVTATLKVCASSDSSTTDFWLRVYNYAWASSLCTNQEANYDGAYTSGGYEGYWATSAGWSVGTYYTMSVSTANINVAGATRYSLVSGRDVNNATPTGAEYVGIYMADQAGTDKDPILEVYYLEATPTPTPTNTPTITPTPTPTAICPTALLTNTTWGPGWVVVNCNVGVGEGYTLTVLPNTEVRFMGDHKVDVLGKLYAVGTVTEPITFTTGLTKTDQGLWSFLTLRGDQSELTYVNMYYGEGVNDAAGSTLRYCNLMSNTCGLASLADVDVSSCTLQYNSYGLLMYSEGRPEITACNILSNTWDVYMNQYTDIEVPGCWWGADPPDGSKIWDYLDDFTLGLVDLAGWATSWIGW